MDLWTLDVITLKDDEANAQSSGATQEQSPKAVRSATANLTYREKQTNRISHKLFGCTEDVYCQARGRFCRPLCEQCRVPICKECSQKLFSFNVAVGTIPMAIANDNYYTYVLPEIAAGEVTWLESAAASVCFSTILVCYLEEPYGHLMLETMEGAQARTHVRGNLFSFVMPWEDVAKCCEQALQSKASRTAYRANAKRKQTSEGRPLLLPLDEETLATLVNVHLVGGTKDLKTHLEGVTMRVEVVERLITHLRESGYAGYEKDGPNSSEEVERRLAERYTKRYGEGPLKLMILVSTYVDKTLRACWCAYVGLPASF